MCAVLDSGLDENAVAERYAAFGLSVPKLQRYRSLGKGPRFRKVGRVVTYDSKDVEQWLEECKVEPNKRNQSEDISE
jgi:predicted DNA-binding transcriptional regulator AlpA